MSQPLPALRRSLDIMPSPMPDRPGLLIRDPYHYSDAVIVVPPPLVPGLMLFDGRHTELDLRELLVRITRQLEVGEVLGHLVGSLSQAGFLENDVFAGLREKRHREFAEAPRRLATHAGSAYPEEPGQLAAELRGYLDEDGAGEAERARRDGLLAIAAPHVSPEGGWRCYRAAYRCLEPRHRERTFVVLGTSHYGEPERFGLTRKPFVTPLGEAVVDGALVERLAAGAGSSARMEDYCHSVEHSIEFQLLFLQHVCGPDIRVLPILCGPFARSTREGGWPEDDEGVARFLGALGELSAREGDRLLWILGIDMAHMGRRYGDSFHARAARGPMEEVEGRDRKRIERVTACDARGFWALVQENGDDLKWCGASPLYTFLKSVCPPRGELLLYEQWNIDEQSVVTFAGLAFSKGPSQPGVS